VIGGLGFIGSNLAVGLAEAGARVTVLTRNRLRHAATAAAQEALGISIVEGDMRDIATMREVVADREWLFHAAGQSGAARSMEDPWTDLDINCRGSLVVLEALREVNREAKVVFVGSRLEYGRVAELPAAEDGDLDPLCLYAVHKLAVEHYLRLYSRLFGIRYTVARVTNPYGPGQRPTQTAYGVVNRMIHLALSDDTLTVYGDGVQQRDYIYIDDVVSALIALARSSHSDGRIYNVGTGVGTRLVDMAETIVRIVGAGRIVAADWPELVREIETGDFVADISRIGGEIGWRPMVALEDGLERTVASSRAQVAR
jgi:UDP-glucose 4-epimerase